MNNQASQPKISHVKCFGSRSRRFFHVGPERGRARRRRAAGAVGGAERRTVLRAYMVNSRDGHFEYMNYA